MFVHDEAHIEFIDCEIHSSKLNQTAKCKCLTLEVWAFTQPCQKCLEGLWATWTQLIVLPLETKCFSLGIV